jgi:hypothetical protein
VQTGGVVRLGPGGREGGGSFREGFFAGFGEFVGTAPPSSGGGTRALFATSAKKNNVGVGENMGRKNKPATPGG